MDIVRVQLENFSFLSQSHVRLLDAEAKLIAESSAPGDVLISLAYSALPAPMWEQQTADMILLGDASQEIQFPADAGVTPIQPSALTSPYENTQQYMPMISVLNEGQFWVNRIDSDESEPSGRGDFFYRIGVAGTPFGFGLNRELSLNSPRSDQQVRVPLFGAADDLLGYLELSEGPAYGAAILKGVLQALTAAGIIAIIVAGGTGWYISRRITAPLLVLTRATSQMAEGQLSARAHLEGGDEFGLLARTFNQMAGKVEGTVTTLRRFVADSAHELHTPITALHANLELAATEPNDSQRITFIERAVEQLKRLEILTGSLLDLSRIEAHSDQSERAPVDLVELVKSTSELYASRAEQAGHCFYFDLPATPVVAHVNEGQLRRALGNLLDNAIKFTPAEGVIGVGLRQQEAGVELWVKDTGIGIPAEELPHIFSRFHRARNTASYAGSGLGLAIIKAIIEGHNGQVFVNSSAQGTCFTLLLPA
jgi:signal transduction histidine kinase